MTILNGLMRKSPPRKAVSSFVLRPPSLSSMLCTLINVIPPPTFKKPENLENLTQSPLRRSQSLGDIEQIQREFSQHVGGEFELIKDQDSGIALLCIKNWSKTNCFTGSMMAKFTDPRAILERGEIVKRRYTTVCSFFVVFSR